MKSLLNILQPIFTWLANNQAIISKLYTPIIAVLAGGVLAVVAAMRVWAVVQGVLSAVMSANPIGIVIVAIAALAPPASSTPTPISKPFRDAINDVWEAIKTLGSWILAHWTLIIGAMLGPIGFLVLNFQTVLNVINDVINALEQIGQKVSSALGWLGKIPPRHRRDRLVHQPVQRAWWRGAGADDDGVPDHRHPRRRPTRDRLPGASGTTSAATSAPSSPRSSGSAPCHSFSGITAGGISPSGPAARRRPKKRGGPTGPGECTSRGPPPRPST